MSYIALLDPSLMNHEGDLSTNLGDIIIYESVNRVLGELFPRTEIVRVASHAALNRQQQQIINQADFAFVGGTNIFLSDYRGFRLLKLKESSFFLWLNPGVKNLIFLGVGWGNSYGNPITWKTKFFYNQLLSHKYIQSARDEYSAQKISPVRQCLNTSCPTLWELAGVEATRKNMRTKTALLTLTDYAENADDDSTLIDICLSYFDKLDFFPQGSKDKEYLLSLQIYQKNKEKIHILPHNISDYYNYIAQNQDFTFVGTRLHGGIKCMQQGRDALIIGVDNRALEIGKDTHLPVIDRKNYEGIKCWLSGESDKKYLHLPLQNIEKWKNQFQ